MLSVFGIGVFALIFGGMLRATARRWRYLAGRYKAGRDLSVKTRHMQSAVLLGLGGFNSLKGIVTIGVSESGVSLRVMPIFSLFHAPLFIPHDEFQGWATSWYLDGQSTELQFRSAPHVNMVVPTETAQWIQGFSRRKMALHDVSPPTGEAGQGWRSLMLVQSGVAAFMVGGLACYLLFGPLG